MPMNLKMILVAVAVLCFGGLSYFLGVAHSGRLMDYRSAVLRHDVVLRRSGSEVLAGTLKKGAVIYAATGTDMGVTDPGDFQLHKVYVRIPLGFDDSLILQPSDEAAELMPRDVCNVLEICASIEPDSDMKQSSLMPRDFPWTRAGMTFRECQVVTLREIHESTEVGDRWWVEISLEDLSTDKCWTFSVDNGDQLATALKDGDICTILCEEEGTKVRLVAVFPGHLRRERESRVVE
jgi:hypothetical protein